MAKNLVKRSEVEEKNTWDLTLIYPNDEVFEQELESVKAKIPALKEYEGTFSNSAKQLADFMEQSLDISCKVEEVYVYAHLKSDQDTANSTYQSFVQRAYALFVEYSSTVAWFEPELLALSDEVLEAYYKNEPRLELYREYFSTARAAKAHILPAEQEALLAEAAEIFKAPSSTFALLNNADLSFDAIVNEDGEEVTLTHGNYQTFIQSKDRKVRKAAYETMYKAYKNLKNTFASTLSSNVKADNYKAKVRHYQSARHAALSPNHIPEAVFETLVNEVNANLSLLHRYVALQKKVLGVDEMRIYDLNVPLTGEAPIKYTYEEAVAETYPALAPLGEEYAGILKEGFENRWIDIYENEGKRSGAYSGGSYSTKPYMLMNWHDDLSHFFTLVHEFGHSAHSYLTRKNQPYIYGDYSIFLAEIASTTNENLLTEYLLAKHQDKESQIYILNSFLDRVKSTIYRQTQFAEFEHAIHVAAANGTPLTTDFLCDSYQELVQRYYGPEVVVDENVSYEWARIPHFYYNYYVYQYATGMAAASALSQKILSGKPEAVEAYLNYLRSGRSDKPIEIMKRAGVDMTQPDYLRDTFAMFEKRLGQLEQLLAK